MVASSSEAAYWPSRYSRTYDGTTALPRTPLTRSLRTTAPAKYSLIFSSRPDFVGVASAASAAAPAARPPIPSTASSRFVMALLDVAVRRDRMDDRQVGNECVNKCITE